MRRKFLTALAIIILLSLTACGRQETQDVPGGANAIQTVAADTYWTEERWIHNGGAVSMHPLYLTEEIKGLDAEPDEAYDGRTVTYCVLGNIIYGLEDFYRKTGDGWEHFYYIIRYDGTDEGVLRWPIELSLPEEYAGKEFVAAAFDVKGEQELVLFLQGHRDDLSNTACYLAVHMTPEGELLSVTDLYPALRELGVGMETTYQTAYVDGDGYYYLLTGQNFGEEGRVNVFDSDGKSVGTMTPGEGYSQVKWAMKLPDGSPVFSWSDYGNMYILLQIYDREENTARALLEERLRNAWLWTPGADGYLYYVNNGVLNTDGELMRCDIRTGSVEDCMYYWQLGLDGNSKSEQLVRMVIGEGGEPEFLGSKGGETVICRLGTEAPEKEAVRLCGRAFRDYEKEGAVLFSQKHPDCPVVLEYPEESEDKEAYWDRAMAELVSGKGADIYNVDISKMRTLQEKGALADLSELISEETLAALWPAALEMGTLDGQLVGIPLEAWVESMFVSDEIWAGDHWTLEEALEVLEAHPEMQYPLVSNASFDNYDVLSWLVIKSLADSPFLDMEKGTCDFENPLFIRALELAGACTKSFDFSEAQELYPEKDWLAMRIDVNIGNFNDYKTILGEEYHIVGFPTEGESGTYWNSGGVLVVNRETEHEKEIGLFLEELLSYDRQYTLFFYEPVRRDMLDNRLHRKYGGMYIEYGNGWMRELTPGPEGDYRIGEYKSVMEKSMGQNADTSAIADIIMEEAGSYFSGARDAAAVAGTIQNREQLYLKERQ
ncbi:MAG: ABC transporter substrate-binding protein [Acetatifactor sp.]|nr:ABC transporter substrate-binding protein [Acetatifactor sp.]